MGERRLLHCLVEETSAFWSSVGHKDMKISEHCRVSLKMRAATRSNCN